jgi:hypothetical protein
MSHRIWLTGQDSDGRTWEVRDVSIDRWPGSERVIVWWGFADQPRANNLSDGQRPGLERAIFDGAMASPRIQAELTRRRRQQDRADQRNRAASAAVAARDARSRQAARREFDARLAVCQAHGTPVYVRFGVCPAGGQSYNHKDNRYEAGVSVYGGWRLPDATVVLDMRTVDWISHVFSEFAGRAMFLAAGRRVGTGSDGEPLLADVTLTPAGVDDYEIVG